MRKSLSLALQKLKNGVEITEKNLDFATKKQETN
jgi:hypothetical protein